MRWTHAARCAKVRIAGDRSHSEHNERDMSASSHTQSRSEVDRLHVFHPFSVLQRHERSGPRRMIVRGSGSTVYDEEGRAYIDAMAGLWCVNVGYGRARARRRAARAGAAAALLPLVLLDGDRHAGAAGRAPDRARAGGDVEGALRHQRLRRQRHPGQARPPLQQPARAPRRRRRSSRARRGYHGVSIASAQPDRLRRHARGLRPADRRRSCTRRRPTGCARPSPGRPTPSSSRRLAADLDALILAEGPDTVAAFIAEPVQAAGGVIVPPEGYFAGDPGGAAPARRAADRRRGRLRLRPARQLVRQRGARASSPT